MKSFLKPFPRQLAGVGFMVLLVSVYWPGLSGGFFFDDFVNLVQSRSIKIDDLSTETLLRVWDSGVAGPLGRPISMLTFAANYYFSRLDPFWFKLTNLFIHCINACLVFVVAKLIAKVYQPLPKSTQRSGLVAGFVAVLWAFHPIQLTSVLYVVQRMTSLSSMFVLLALILHISARQRKGGAAYFVVAWGLAGPLAILSKETGVLLVLYVAVYEGVIHRSIEGRFDRFARLYLSILLLASAFLVCYLSLFSGNGLLKGYETRSFTFEERLLTEFRIILEYLWMIVAPALSAFSLHHDDIVISTGFFEPIETLYSCLLVGLLLAFAWFMRARNPVFSFGILWFMVGHSLESTIFPLELMHEHRNYLPSFGIFMAIGSVLGATTANNKTYRLLSTGSILAFAAYCAFLTFLRADMYGNDFRRTQVEAGYHPESVRSQYEAGALIVNMYNRRPEPILGSLALKHFEQVNSLDKAYKLALVGMLQLDCLSNGTSRSDVFEELKARLTNSKWVPTDRLVMHGIAEMANEGTVCFSRDQVDQLFSAALGNRTATPQDRSVVRSDYALYLWMGQKDYLAARDVLTAAISDNEHDILNRINLLHLLRLDSDRRGGIALLADLQERQLSRKDRILVDKIAYEMAVENVVNKDHGKN